MFKRIRDFIYDINDIFIALVIILVAVGIIVWRSTMIMSYPEYLANKEAAAANTVTPIDAPLTPAVNTTQNVTINISPNTGSQNTAVQTNAADNTAENNTAANTADNQNAQSGVSGETNTSSNVPAVTVSLIVDRGDAWSTIVDRLIRAGLVAPEDRQVFISGVMDLGLSGSGLPGTYELSSNMSYEEMIKIICNKQ